MSNDDLNIDDLHLKDFFNVALNGYAIADPKGRIIKANPTLIKWLGLPDAKINGKRFSDFLAIGGKIYYETHLWPLLRMQGHFDEIAVDLLGETGKKLPVLLNALEHRDENGKVLSVWITIFKATDRFTYEQNLKNANAFLEVNLVNAKQITTLRDQFISILGHDLRNPLGSVTACATILSKSKLEQQDQKIVQVIMRSSIRMAELINNIMDFAQTRLGQGIVINRLPTFIEPYLIQVVDELRSIYPKRVIETDFTLMDAVDCDGPRIAQLMSNLIANAITHGNSNTPVIVKAQQSPDLFEMSVINNGDAIPQNLLETLFEPFTRESHQPSKNGLGLGLYIAYQIAIAHKGDLKVISTPEQTTFTLTLDKH